MRILAAVACLMLAISLQAFRDRTYARDTADAEPLLYVRSPAAASRIALGFDALAADVYWIRALQHYGAQRLAPAGEPRGFPLLYPLLDLTTTLDPYFNIAYRFGAIFLSEAPPGGPGRPDLAVQLLRKGLAAQPGKWQYHHDIGFVHYWAMRDPVAAAEWFRRAAEQPNAPNWLLPVAAAMLTQGTDRRSARHLWRQILDANEPWLRQRAERALLQIDAMDEIDALEAVVAAIPRQAHEPVQWTDLLRARRLRGIPVDPTGIPYELDPQTGRVRVSERSALFPMPDSVEKR